MSSTNLSHNSTVNDIPSAKEILAQESRRLIDEKIAIPDEFTRQFESQRNELAFISQLPPEILIIMLCK